MGDAGSEVVKTREKKDSFAVENKKKHRRAVSDAFEDPSTEGFVDDDELMTSQLQEGWLIDGVVLARIPKLLLGTLTQISKAELPDKIYIA